jgi:type II secretion system protein G
MKKNIKGFTLIELLVVIAIIGLLSTLAVVSLNSARMKARDARRQSDLRQISTAMELYKTQNDSYPLAAAACGTAAAPVAGVIADNATPHAVCISAPLVDAANNNYIQRVPADPNNSGTHVYTYVPGTDAANSYCIQAVLEQPQVQGGTTYNDFTCTNGSCVLSAGC